MSKVAVYYDAENIGHSRFDEVIDAACSYGRICSIKIYGNLGLLGTASWRKIAKHEGVEMVVCEGTVKGKNSADIRLVIDATRDVDNKLYTDYVIVSNDSDFEPLAKCIRIQGAHAHSVGTDAGGDKYEGAFDTLTVLDGSNHGVSNMKSSSAQVKKKKSKDTPSQSLEGKDKGQGQCRKVTPELREALVRIIGEVALADGWATGTSIGQAIRKEQGKTHKDYGFSTLRKMLEAAEIAEFRGCSSANWEARLLSSASPSSERR